MIFVFLTTLSIYLSPLATLLCLAVYLRHPKPHGASGPVRRTAVQGFWSGVIAVVFFLAAHWSNGLLNGLSGFFGLFVIVFSLLASFYVLSLPFAFACEQRWHEEDSVYEQKRAEYLRKLKWYEDHPGELRIYFRNEQ